MEKILNATEEIKKQLDEMIAYQKETIQMIKDWKPEPLYRDYEAKAEEMNENDSREREEIFN